MRLYNKERFAGVITMKPVENVMKKLLFDGTAMQSYPGITFHGGGEYAKYMLREMIERGYDFDIVLDDNRVLDDETRKLIDSAHKGEVLHIKSTPELYALIDERGYDTFYSALPYQYTSYPCRARLVGVVHGLRRVELPWDSLRYKYFKSPLKRMVAYVISHSKMMHRCFRKKYMRNFAMLFNVPGARFITVSNHSKHSILNFFPAVDASNIKVFYSPFTPADKPSDSFADYYLMVSGNRFEKNIYRAVKAFDRLFSQGRLQGKRVVVTGCGNAPWWNEINNRERFELLPYVSAEQLNDLYAHAFAFVYPSLNEGFGYPPLMAMSYGVPVAASAATSIPEACDDAAIYFCPTDEYDMANRILQLDLDTDLRERLRRRGLRRVSHLMKRQQDEMDAQLTYIFE